MQYTYYKLADLIIRVGFDFSYLAERSYMYQFLVPPVNEPDYCLDFRQTNNINTFFERVPQLKGRVAKFHYYQDEKGTEYCFHLNGNYYHAVTVLGEKSGVCYYISQAWLADQVKNGYYLENFFCLEKILMQFGCMILHSCHIHHNGSAILFSAPSGTGKSTQGELWRQYAHAEVINGDRTAIRKINGVWTAYGVPFCGTSQIHLNKQAPLKAIVVLRQNPENCVSRLKEKDAFSSIYSELTVNNWNQQFVDCAINWTLELISQVPVYKFLCTKERDAVSALGRFMEQNEREAKENVGSA